MEKKRFVSLLLVLTLVMGLFAGVTASAEAAFPDYSQGFAERVTIQIPVYDRAFEGWNVTDNYFTRWMQQEFGDKYNVEVKYVAIGRSTEVTDYQQMLASHTAPDIIFHYDMPQALAYYGEGVMQPLNWEEIANYAPTYWANLQSTIESYSTVNDQKTFFFAQRPMAYNYMRLFRKDWADKVGVKMEDLTSLEKYNEMLLKWKDAGIGVNGERLKMNNFTYNYPYRDWPVDEAYRALYSDLSVADLGSVATERYLRNLNEQYNLGTVDKEFYLRDDDAKARAEFIAGKVGMVELYMANNSDVLSSTLANNPDAEFAALDLAALTPEGLKPQERGYWPFGMIMGINYETTDEERAAIWMFLDWMSQPENLFKLQNGVEGENYTLDADGIALKTPEFAGESVLSQNNNKDYWCLVIESAEYADPETNMKANIRNWAPEGYEQLIIDNIDAYQRYTEFRTPDALFSVVLEKVAEYSADLNVLFQELYVKCVIAPVDQFDATYEEAKQTYLDAGYQEILDEKQAAIDAGNYASGLLQ